MVEGYLQIERGNIESGNWVMYYLSDGPEKKLLYKNS